MVKVVDADKINYPYCKAWPTLLDHVPVDDAMDAGWTICSNWVSEVPEDEVRHLEDNEEEYYKIIKEYN